MARLSSPAALVKLLKVTLKWTFNSKGVAIHMLKTTDLKIIVVLELETDEPLPEKGQNHSQTTLVGHSPKTYCQEWNYAMNSTDIWSKTNTTFKPQASSHEPEVENTKQEQDGTVFKPEIRLFPGPNPKGAMVQSVEGRD